MDVVAASIRGASSPFLGRLAICVAVLIAHSEARASECAADPACHLEKGKQLLKSDPKRAAEELLASFKIDERTDTLALYATALQLDGRYAHAIETWRRVIVFREGELNSGRGSRKRAAKKGLDQAAAAISKLSGKVARARIRIPNGEQLAVSRGGIEVDVTRDVLVNAGRDELVFTRKDGTSERVVVEIGVGEVAMVEPLAAPEAPKPRTTKQPSVARTAPRKLAPAASELKRPAPKPEAEEAEAQPLATTRFVEEPRSRTLSRVGLGMVAGAVIAGGIAGTFGYLGNRDYDRARETGCNAGGECQVGPAADLAERSNDRTRLAQISAIGGGALLVTGVTMWIIGRGKTKRAATDVTLQVGSSSAALSWGF